MTDNLNPAGIDAAMAMLAHYGVKEEHARIAIRAYEAERVKGMDQHFAAAVSTYRFAVRQTMLAIGRDEQKDADAGENFARESLLAKHETAIRAAILAERESCAQILDENAKLCRDMNFRPLAEATEGVAKAIRGRAAP